MPAASFVVTVLTGPLRDTQPSSAGSAIHICLVGENGESEYLQIGEVAADVQLVTEIQLDVDIGLLEEILIGHDEEEGLGVFVRAVTVLAQHTGLEYKFHSNFWLQDSADGQSHRAMRMSALPRSTDGSQITMTERQSAVQFASFEYTVIIETGMQRNAVCPMQLLMCIVGADGDSGDVSVVRIKPLSPLQGEVTLTCASYLGEIQCVLLGLQPDNQIMGPQPDVFIEKLVVLDRIAKLEYSFKGKTWIQDEIDAHTANSLELIPIRIRKLKNLESIHQSAAISRRSSFASQTSQKQGKTMKISSKEISPEVVAGKSRTQPPQVPEGEPLDNHSWALSRIFPESHAFQSPRREIAVVPPQSPTQIAAADPTSQPHESNILVGVAGRVPGRRTYEIPGKTIELIPVVDDTLRMAESLKIIRYAKTRVSLFDSGRLSGYDVPKDVLENDVILFIENSKLLEPPEGTVVTNSIQAPRRYTPSIDMFTYSYSVTVFTGAVRAALTNTCLLVCIVGEFGESGDWEAGGVVAGGEMRVTINVHKHLGRVQHIVLGLVNVNTAGTTALQISQTLCLDVHAGVTFTANTNNWLQTETIEVPEPCLVCPITSEQETQPAEHPDKQNREIVLCKLFGQTRGQIAVAASNIVEWCAMQTEKGVWCEMLDLSYNDAGTCAVAAVAVVVKNVLLLSKSARLLASAACRVLRGKNLCALINLAASLSQTSRARSYRRLYGRIVSAGRSFGSSCRMLWIRLSHICDVLAADKVLSSFRMRRARRDYIQVLVACQTIATLAARRGAQMMYVQMRVLPWAVRRSQQSKVWIDFKLISLLDKRQICARVLQQSIRRALPHKRYVDVRRAIVTILAMVSRTISYIMFSTSETQWASITLAAFARRAIVEYTYLQRGYEEMPSPSPEVRAAAARHISRACRRVLLRRTYFKLKFREAYASDALRSAMLRRIARRRYLESEVNAELLQKGKSVSRRPLSALLALARVDKLLDDGGWGNTKQTNITLQFVDKSAAALAARAANESSQGRSRYSRGIPTRTPLPSRPATVVRSSVTPLTKSIEKPPGATRGLGPTQLKSQIPILSQNPAADPSLREGEDPGRLQRRLLADQKRLVLKDQKDSVLKKKQEQAQSQKQQALEAAAAAADENGKHTFLKRGTKAGYLSDNARRKTDEKNEDSGSGTDVSPARRREEDPASRRRRQEILRAQIQNPPKTRISSDGKAQMSVTMPGARSMNLESGNETDESSDTRAKKRRAARHSWDQPSHQFLKKKTGDERKAKSGGKRTKRAKSEAAMADAATADETLVVEDDPYLPTQNEYVAALTKEIERQLQKTLFAPNAWNEVELLPQAVSKARRNQHVPLPTMANGGGIFPAIANPHRVRQKARPAWMTQETPPPTQKLSAAAIASQLTAEASNRIRDAHWTN